MKRIRQAVVLARDLARTVDTLTRVLDICVAYRDPGVESFGLVNAVMPVGTTFLEVVSPMRPEASGARFLERRGGDAGYMLLIQTDDLPADRARIDELGIRSVWSVDLDDIAAVHLHPSDTGGAILSLDQPNPAESWRWGGPDWQKAIRTTTVDAIVGAEFAAKDPVALARRWADILGARLETRSPGMTRIALDTSALLFRQVTNSELEGLVAIDFHARDLQVAVAKARAANVPVLSAAQTRAELLIAGTRFRLSTEATPP